MIRSSFWDYKDAYLHAKGTIAVSNTSAEGATPNIRSKKVIFKSCAPIINCRGQVNSTQVDDAHDIGAVMPMYNLVEYSNICSKTSGSLWQYDRDESDLDNNNIIINFPADDNISVLFEFKEKITW